MSDVPLSGFDHTFRGEEAQALRTLARAGVPLAEGRIVPRRNARRAASELAFDLAQGYEALQRPLSDGDQEWMRIVGAEAAQHGSATSADPDAGDPEDLHVWHVSARERPFRIDRRSARVSEAGGELSTDRAESVADLVDRVQLALGRPVEIDWCVQAGGRSRVLAVRPLLLRPTFMPGSWSRLALVAADEGTVAPLAIDALDRGLRAESSSPDVEATVRRVYARPYRRRAHDNARLGREEPETLTRSTAEVARVARLGAEVLRDALPFERGLDYRRSSLEKPQLAALGEQALLEAVRERHRLVAEAFLLLDRCRELTRRALEALESVIGRLPEGTVAELAAPLAVRERRRAHERILKLRRRLEQRGEWNGTHVPMPLRKRFEETKRELSELRPLGIDVIPLPMGSSDEALLMELRRVSNVGHSAREEARDEAIASVLRAASGRSVGVARVGLARTMTLLLGRIARVKGGVGEGVAAALLQLRRAACEVGTRLCDSAILDEADDALYLSLVELEEALIGEPGAYAARVRFRREDDQRWANYDAPRRIGD